LRNANISLSQKANRINSDNAYLWSI
jgi:hypothetical protein